MKLYDIYEERLCPTCSIPLDEDFSPGLKEGWGAQLEPDEYGAECQYCGFRTQQGVIVAMGDERVVTYARIDPPAPGWNVSGEISC